MPHNARFLYQQPKIEINNYLIVNWFSLPLQTVEKHLVSPIENKFFHSRKFIFSEWEQMKIFYLFLILTKGILASLRLYI